MENMNINEIESLVQLKELIPSVDLNKVFDFTIKNLGFDNLSNEKIIEILKDGRVFSHFIEHWLSMTFGLIHVSGCKDHDFTDPSNSEIFYDQKTFTKGGCKFMPSNMIGSGRIFNQSDFEKKANKLIYCIVSNINFPEIKIIFIRGSDLITKYPLGSIPFKDHDKIFSSISP
tara:strand:- start:1034 stop:1552 length:519 start_codon:yes stop_codon:yes gene_type:complete